MRKKGAQVSLIIFFLLIFFGVKLHAQFNNEWINFNKTYYKFKVGETGLYRIPFATLQAAGIGNTSAEQFQLWRNGSEVALYTSVSAGQMGANDFIEFLGIMNDGKSDAVLYKKPEFQLADKWSLQTDTAAYFLTINSLPNKRLLNAVNDLTTNKLPPEPFFLHTLSKSYRDQINPGYASIVGIYVYSSSYDNGEGWTSRNITNSAPIVDQYNNLYVDETNSYFVVPTSKINKNFLDLTNKVLKTNQLRSMPLHREYVDDGNNYNSLKLIKRKNIVNNSNGKPKLNKIINSNTSNFSKFE